MCIMGNLIMIYEENLTYMDYMTIYGDTFDNVLL